MAKAKKREYIWLECKDCGDRNYRTEVSVAGGTPKFELKKYCKRERKHTAHKIRRKQFAFIGQQLNWQSSGLQNRRLGVRLPPDLLLFGKQMEACKAVEQK